MWLASDVGINVCWEGLNERPLEVFCLVMIVSALVLAPETGEASASVELPFTTVMGPLELGTLGVIRLFLLL